MTVPGYVALGTLQLRNQIVKAIVADACAFSMTGGSVQPPWYVCIIELLPLSRTQRRRNLIQKNYGSSHSTPRY